MSTSDLRQKLLGYGVLWGGPDPADMLEVIEALERDAAEGEIDVQFALGNIYSDGELIPKNDAATIKWWLMAAEGGDMASQFNCGQCYQFGIGTPKNFKEAGLWYLKAARQGDMEAQYILAVYALSSGQDWVEEDDAGDGSELEAVYAAFDRLWTETERKEMRSMLWTAAEGGYAEAQYEVARMYEDGMGGVRKDIEEARKWHSLAAKQGLKHAHTALLKLGK